MPPITFSTKIKHNNPREAIIDNTEILGGALVVEDLDGLLKLGLPDTINKVLEGVTQVYVKNSDILYLLINKGQCDETGFSIDAWKKIKDFAGDIRTTEISQKITYDQLQGKINDNGLITGHKYIITDYKVVPKQNYTFSGTQDYLVLTTAISSNVLDTSALLLDSEGKKVADIEYNINPSNCKYLDDTKETTLIAHQYSFAQDIECRYISKNKAIIVDKYGGIYIDGAVEGIQLKYNSIEIYPQSIAFNASKNLLYIAANSGYFKCNLDNKNVELLKLGSDAAPNGKLFYVNNVLYCAQSNKIITLQGDTVKERPLDAYINFDVQIIESDNGIVFCTTDKKVYTYDNQNLEKIFDIPSDENITALYYTRVGVVVYTEVNGNRKQYYGVDSESVESYLLNLPLDSTSYLRVNDLYEIGHYTASSGQWDSMKVENYTHIQILGSDTIVVFFDKGHTIYKIQEIFTKAKGGVTKCIDLQGNQFPYDHITIKNNDIPVLPQNCKNIIYKQQLPEPDLWLGNFNPQNNAILRTSIEKWCDDLHTDVIDRVIYFEYEDNKYAYGHCPTTEAFYKFNAENEEWEISDDDVSTLKFKVTKLITDINGLTDRTDELEEGLSSCQGTIETLQKTTLPLVICTQAEYDELSSKDANTLYFIKS